MRGSSRLTNSVNVGGLAAPWVAYSTRAPPGAAWASVDAYRRRIPTAKVNAVIRDAQMAQAAPGGARVLYATQGASHPPTFTLFVNRELPQPYMRYLERKLREAFDLGATAVKLRVRRRGE